MPYALKLTTGSNQFNPNSFNTKAITNNIQQVMITTFNLLNFIFYFPFATLL